MRGLLLLLCSCLASPLFANPPSLSGLAQPAQLNASLIGLGPFAELGELVSEIEAHPKTPLLLGILRPIAANTADGAWQTLNNGNRLWQLAIQSADAKTIAVKFEQFELNDQAKLWVYSANRKSVFGPFNKQDKNALGQFWTPAVNGDTIVLELETPVGASPAIQLTQLEHGIRQYGKNDDPQHKAAGDSGSCNQNVACADSNTHAAKINATALLKFRVTDPGSGATGTFGCSGTLINNTSQDGKPYFLTANHCIENNTVAMDATTHWEFQADSCADTTGSDSQLIAVKSLVATWPTNDFSLLELASTPPAAYSPYWSGWDRTRADLNRGTGIHHPSADLKKISTTTTPMPIVNGSGNPNDATNANGEYVQVSPWATGTTEGGSSGSGLWNAAELLVGQLSAGNASCLAPNGQDLYGWIGQAWEGGGSPQSRLKDWLDPNNTGVSKLAGCNHLAIDCAAVTTPPPPQPPPQPEPEPEPEPKPEPVPEPAPEPAPTPDPEPAPAGGGGGSAATLLVLGLGAHYLRRRFRCV